MLLDRSENEERPTVVEPVRSPALEKNFALDVFNALHVMEMKPAFGEGTAHRGAAGVRLVG